MSHIPQRKEKDCLNCGTIVVGRYCHVCGQENVVPKETFWHMVTHFFYDVTHFDSNFFHTVHHLILKPGFLSKEYLKGRRVSYLHPIRMYVFTSAVFFLLFFSFFAPKHGIKTNLDDPIGPGQRASLLKQTQASLKKDPSNSILLERLAELKDTSRVITELDATKMEEGEFRPISFTNRKYKDLKQYDSLQKELPSAERDGWFMRRLVKKEIEVNEKYKENPDEALNKFAESLLHRLPYMLFVSLPLFALILKLVYIRRKQFYFADHGVFTIHLYVFTFLLLLVIFSLDKLNNLISSGFANFLMFALIVLMYFYLYKAMRNFYGQRRGKTFIKFLMVSFLSLIMMLILFLFFLFFSAVTF